MNHKFFRIRLFMRTYSRRVRTKSHNIYLANHASSFGLVSSRLTHFQSLYRDQFGYTFSYKKISIKNVSSRWGSCSRKGNLNFNFRLALLPPELADYIIVHELCHLGEFNHSKKFWDLVALTIPNWQKLRNGLKEHSKRLF